MRTLDRGLIAGVLLAGSVPAMAEPRSYVDLPAGTLGNAVVALGQQARISIGVSDPRLAALPVKRVQGRMSVRKALDRLLEGSPARAVKVGSYGWRIVRGVGPPRQPMVPRPPRNVAFVPLPAEEPPGEIIVTGNKRKIPLSDYPGSVSVLTLADWPPGEEGKGTGAISARLPGVTSTHFGPGRNKLFIRGIADSSFNGPTQATVGQYLGETRINYNAPDPDLRLYDIATIEVLQGPQGTLHGAGSLGGVIRILPVMPKLGEAELSMSAAAAVTAHGAPSYDGSVMVNLPLFSDTTAIRGVGYAVQDGGYIDDTLRDLKDVNRTRTYGGRLALRSEPGDGWTIDVGGVYQSIDGRDGQYSDRDLPGLTRESLVAQPFSNEYALGQVIIRKEWANGLSFVSATGGVRQNMVENFVAAGDDPGFTQLFTQRGRLSLLTSETRLSYERDQGIGWVFGTSLVRNRYQLTRTTKVGPIESDLLGVGNGVNEATLFGEMTIPLASKVSATVGARATYAQLSGRAFDGNEGADNPLEPIDARRKEKTVLPSVAVTYVTNERLSVFARYQEGFRPGGIAVRNEDIRRFRNDEVSSAEVGARYHGDGTGNFTAALSFAYTQWRNIQADLIDDVGLPTTLNIGDGRIFSIDATVAWRPLPNLKLEAAGVFADSRLTEPASEVVVAADSAGRARAMAMRDAVIIESDELPNVSRFNARIGADYGVLIGDRYNLRISAWARYVGRSRLGVGDVLSVDQGDYVDTALNARLGRDNYGIFINATNLFDTIGNRFALGSPFTLPQEDQITPLRPRTIRIGIDARF